MVLYQTRVEALKALKVTLKVIRKDGSKFVQINAPLYINKQWEHPVSYSEDFSDWKVIADVAIRIAARYGGKAHVVGSHTPTTAGYYIAQCPTHYHRIG